ncbi:MAG: hypothetical protein ACJAT2_000232 [Bacteriovoracaceae bacterium]|jgi:hypothetical protein
MANIQISLLKFIESYKKEIILGFLFLIGAVFGGSHYLTWNDIVENAAFKAGLVEYSIETPQYYFQNRLNSFFYVAAEALLHLGFSEYTLAILTSSFLGGLSFFTLGYIGLRFFFSYWVIAAVIMVDYFLLYEFGVNYDVSIVNTKNPQGHFGLIASLLILTYHSESRSKKSAFLMGCSSIFHLTLGAWIITGLLLFEVIEKNVKDYKRTLLPMFLGILTSFLFYTVTSAPGASSFFKADSGEFFKYLQLWDLHQQPYSFLDKGIWVSMIILISLFFVKTEKVLKTTFSAFFFIAILHGFLGHRLHFMIPNIWWGLMPSRLLNFIILFGSSFFFLNALRKKTLASSLTLLLYSIVFFNILYIGKGEILFSNQIEKYKNLLFGLYLGSFLLLILSQYLSFLQKDSKIPHTTLRGIIGMAFIITLGTQFYYLPNAYSFNRAELKYYKNDSQLMDLNNEATLLLTSPSIKQFQLISGKAIVFELDTIDDLLYNPEKIQDSSKYIADLYGIDFFSPQKDFRNNIELLDSWVKINWESKDSLNWSSLKERYHFSHIITPASWNLKLEVQIETKKWKAYKVN